MSTSTSGALRLAEEYAIRGKFEEAIGIYRRVVEIDPSNIAARARLNELYGLAKHAQGSNGGQQTLDSRTSAAAATRPIEPLAAADDFHDQRAIASAPEITVDEGHLIANISRAELSFGFGSFDEAIAILTSLLQRYPDEPRIYAKLKDIYLRSGMPDKAAAAYLDLARIYEAKGDTKMAAQCLGSAERLSNAVPEYSDLRGTGNLVARYPLTKIPSTPKQPPTAPAAHTAPAATAFSPAVTPVSPANVPPSKDQSATPAADRLVSPTPGAQLAREKSVPAAHLEAPPINAFATDQIAESRTLGTDRPPNVTDELASVLETPLAQSVPRAADEADEADDVDELVRLDEMNEPPALPDTHFGSPAAVVAHSRASASVVVTPEDAQLKADVGGRQTSPSADIAGAHSNLSPTREAELDAVPHLSAAQALGVEEIPAAPPPTRPEPYNKPAAVAHSNGASAAVKEKTVAAGSAAARLVPKKASKGTLMGVSMDTGPIKESPQKSSASHFLAAAIVVVALGGSVGGYYVLRAHHTKAATVADAAIEAASVPEPQTSPDSVAADGQPPPEVVTATTEPEAKVTDLSQETPLTPQQQREQQQREQQQRAQDQKAEQQKEQQLEQQRREADFSRQAQEQAALAAQSQPASSPSNSPAQARSFKPAPPSMNTIGVTPAGNAAGTNLTAGGIPRTLQTPPPPVAKAPSSIRSTGYVYGDIIRRVQPSYPQMAKATHATGTVSVEVNINEQGDVVSAHVLSGPGMFASAAESAARGYKFKPTTLDGRPTKISRTLVFNFKEQ
jgi:TonB family protein